MLNKYFSGGTITQWGGPNRNTAFPLARALCTRQSPRRDVVNDSLYLLQREVVQEVVPRLREHAPPEFGDGITQSMDHLSTTTLDAIIDVAMSWLVLRGN